MRSKTACVGAVVAAVLAAVLLGAATRAQDKKPKEEPKKPTVMQRKLAHSHKVLEALAKKDFKELEVGADGLIECAKDLTWKINETERYLVYTNDFLRRAEGLKKAAKDKNIDAAALSYVDLTLTCVKCHQFLRGDDVRAVPEQAPVTARR
jgi:cytochrome c556